MTPAGSPWNGGAQITTPPYSTDADPAFSTTELSNIVAIWRAVAEDYSPFDIDITTEYPGSEGLLGNSATTGGGMRVAIGGSALGGWMVGREGGTLYWEGGGGALGSYLYTLCAGRYHWLVHCWTNGRCQSKV